MIGDSQFKERMPARCNQRWIESPQVARGPLLPLQALATASPLAMATSREAAAQSVLVADGAPEGKLEENVLLDAWYVAGHATLLPSCPRAHAAGARTPGTTPSPMRRRTHRTSPCAISTRVVSTSCWWQARTASCWCMGARNWCRTTTCWRSRWRCVCTTRTPASHTRLRWQSPAAVSCLSTGTCDRTSSSPCRPFPYVQRPPRVPHTRRGERVL